MVWSYPAGAFFGWLIRNSASLATILPTQVPRLEIEIVRGVRSSHAIVAAMSAETLASTIRVGIASWSEPEFVKAGWYPKGLTGGGEWNAKCTCESVHIDIKTKALPLNN